MGKRVTLADIKRFFSEGCRPVTATEIKELPKEDRDELKVLLAEAA